MRTFPILARLRELFDHYAIPTSAIRQSETKNKAIPNENLSKCCHNGVFIRRIRNEYAAMLGNRNNLLFLLTAIVIFIDIKNKFLREGKYLRDSKRRSSDDNKVGRIHRIDEHTLIWTISARIGHNIIANQNRTLSPLLRPLICSFFLITWIVERRKTPAINVASISRTHGWCRWTKLILNPNSSEAIVSIICFLYHKTR